MARKVSPRGSAKRKATLDQFQTDVDRWFDVEKRLNDWEQFFGDVLKPFTRTKSGELKADVPPIARVAQRALSKLRQARKCYASNQLRGSAVSLLDMALLACECFSLAAAEDVAVRDKAVENLKAGRKRLVSTNRQRSQESQRLDRLIREEVADIQKTSRIFSTSARTNLSKRKQFKDGTPMVSLRRIHGAFAKQKGT